MIGIESNLLEFVLKHPYLWNIQPELVSQAILHLACIKGNPEFVKVILTYTRINVNAIRYGWFGIWTPKFDTQQPN